MTPAEISSLQLYLARTFGNKAINLRARPKQPDSVEVYLGEEFIAVIYREEEDGELSYQFQMAILDIDLDDGLS